MRALWRGVVSFGLVNIPIKLYAATERKSLKFSYLHEACKTPVQYRKWCPACQVEVSMDDIVRGYEYDKGQYVVMREEDFEAVPLGTTRSIDIIDFVDLSEIDPIYFDKTYFLEPADTGLKAYSLLRQAMAETSKVALAKVVIRSKENLATVRVYQDQALVMETMFFPDEIRDYRQLPAITQEARVQDREIDMAKSLIGSLATSFDPARYTDQYRAELFKLVRQKVEGQQIFRPAEAEPEKVVDLMTALQASLDAVERGREGGDAARVPH
ncbi:MAG: Ku protein [Bacillota bacterium]